MRLVVIFKYKFLYKRVPCTIVHVLYYRQVDFDKTKHLAESSSKQRKAERERIINEERFDTRLKNRNPVEKSVLISHTREKERLEKRQVELEEMQKNQQM